MGAVASALVTDLQMMTTVQRQSVWVCNRSQAFIEIISAWDDREWEKKLCVSCATFRYLCNELRAKLRHESTISNSEVFTKRQSGMHGPSTV